MNQQSQDQGGEVIAGLVERVTFHSSESGFCVLRVRARGHRDLVTTVGHAATISAGEWITASGILINDRTHGLQFKAHFLRTSAPSTLDGIEKCLGSGMIPWHRAVYAKRLSLAAILPALILRFDTHMDRFGPPQNALNRWLTPPRVTLRYCCQFP